MTSREIFRSLIAPALVVVGTVMASPKGFIAPAFWVSLTASVVMIHEKSWKNFLFLWIASALGGIIAQKDVMPIPFSMMASLMVITTLAGLLPFALHRWLFPKFPTFIATLIFPVFYTLFCYMIDHGPQGTWSNLAYTQYRFTSFAMSASLFGLYGILFTIAWFASLFAVIVVGEVTRKKALWMSTTYAVFFTILNLYGVVRKNQQPITQSETAELASVVLNGNFVLETIHKDATHEDITVPEAISFSDPILTKIQQSQMVFMKNPTAPEFYHSRLALDSLQTLYFQKSQEMIRDGAKFILWPEGAIMTMKEDESTKQQRAMDFAEKNHITLFYATAVYHIDKLESGGPFIENKMLTIGPDGTLLNVYFKNVPIMGVEPSFPGDGEIPAIKTSAGIISPAICYDMDFPSLVAQVSQHPTHLMVVPTGDWKSISPYHTYMAAFRAIENGVSIFKSVNGGLSAYIDHNGKILAKSDYYDANTTGIVRISIPVTSVDTPFLISFTLFLNMLLLGALAFLFTPVIMWLNIRFLPMKPATSNA